MKKPARKPILEALPLKPGEEQILRNYPDVVPAIRQALNTLRKPGRPGAENVTLQQVAQQLLQTPHFQGNKQLTALAALNPAARQVAQSPFAGNLVKKPARPLPPMEPQSQQWQQDQQMAQQVAGDVEAAKLTPNAKDFGTPQQGSLRDKMKLMKKQQMGTANTMKLGEAFGVGGAAAMAGGSLQKIFRTVSTLKPEELQLLMKMLTSMLSQGQQTGTSSMSSQSITASQKYKADKIMLESIKRQILKETFKNEVKGQVRNYRLVESLLYEGPMGNVWQGIKQAGTGFADKMKQKMGMNLPDSPEDQAKAYSTELIKFIKKANQTRQQFKSQILKNAEIINTYHDAVAAAWETFSNVGGSLGAASGHLQQQVEELVSNLKYDLESEREQIGSFLNVLKNLKGNVPSADPARQAATAQRDLEASENPPGANSLGKGRRFSSANRTTVQPDVDQVAAGAQAPAPMETKQAKLDGLAKQIKKSKGKEQVALIKQYLDLKHVAQ